MALRGLSEIYGFEIIEYTADFMLLLQAAVAALARLFANAKTVLESIWTET